MSTIRNRAILLEVFKYDSDFKIGLTYYSKLGNNYLTQEHLVVHYNYTEPYFCIKLIHPILNTDNNNLKCTILE